MTVENSLTDFGTYLPHPGQLAKTKYLLRNGVFMPHPHLKNVQYHRVEKPETIVPNEILKLQQERRALISDTDIVVCEPGAVIDLHGHADGIADTYYGFGASNALISVYEDLDRLVNELGLGDFNYIRTGLNQKHAGAPLDTSKPMILVGTKDNAIKDE